MFVPLDTFFGIRFEIRDKKSFFFSSEKKIPSPSACFGLQKDVHTKLCAQLLDDDDDDVCVCVGGGGGLRGFLAFLKYILIP